MFDEYFKRFRKVKFVEDSELPVIKIGYDKKEIIDIHGSRLDPYEYTVLQFMTQKYFGKDVKEYFNKPPADDNDVNVIIENKHVVRLDLDNQGLKEIPREIAELNRLQYLHLVRNQIKKIRHLDDLEELRGLNLVGNLIDNKDPDIKRELKKLCDRGVQFYI